MDLQKLRGTGVALITPFTQEKEVDYDSLGMIVEHLIKGKVEYLVVLGTTGETATLEEQEKNSILAFVKEKAGNRLPLVIGIGGNNTREVQRTIEKTDLSGFSAILSVSPYYNKPLQEGIYQHYAVLAKASPLPIILYNVPGRTSSNMTAATTLRLANDFENIIGMKEASGNVEQVMQILREKPKDFLVVSGDDALTYPFLCLGMDGVISVAAHAQPLEFSNMVRETIAGKYEDGRKLHYQLLPMMTSIFKEGNPGGIKALLSLKGLCRNELRLPLVPVSDGLKTELERL